MLNSLITVEILQFKVWLWTSKYGPDLEMKHFFQVKKETLILKKYKEGEMKKENKEGEMKLNRFSWSEVSSLR